MSPNISLPEVIDKRSLAFIFSRKYEKVIGWLRTNLNRSSMAGRCCRVVNALDCYVEGIPIESDILPLLKHVCGEKWPTAMLAIKEVSQQRWISKNVDLHHICLSQVQIRLPTLALKPRGDVTRSPKQRYQ